MKLKYVFALPSQQPECTQKATKRFFLFSACRDSLPEPTASNSNDMLEDTSPVLEVYEQLH
jgi:hypothetical protein